MWDPAAYLRFGDERGRPFRDLLARVGATRPRAVADLGCGPGTLTATLAERWPGARITGLDSSPAMVAAASRLDTPVEFAVADLRDWRPAPEVDVVVSNAALHWVPDHVPLLVRWAGGLPPGAWLAFQVPGNFDAPTHLALRAVAADPRWADRLGPSAVRRPVPDPAGYARALLAAGCAVDAWETTYLHLLPAGGATHPVLEWLEGTALRPVRAVLDDAEWDAFRDRLTGPIAEAYPVDGPAVAFPFRRVFVVARTAGTAEPAP